MRVERATHKAEQVGFLGGICGLAGATSLVPCGGKS